MTGLIPARILLFHPSLVIRQPYRLLTGFMVMSRNPITLVKQIINLVYIQVPLEEMARRVEGTDRVGQALDPYKYQKLVAVTLSGVVVMELLTSDYGSYSAPYSLFPIFETTMTWIWGLTVSEDKYGQGFMNNLVRLEPIALPIIYCLMDISLDSLLQTTKGFVIAMAVIKLLKITRYDGEDCIKYFWRKTDEWRDTFEMILKAV